jgi:hypothetical protein
VWGSPSQALLVERLGKKPDVDTMRRTVEMIDIRVNVKYLTEKYASQKSSAT